MNFVIGYELRQTYTMWVFIMKILDVISVYTFNDVVHHVHESIRHYLKANATENVFTVLHCIMPALNK